MWLSTNLSVDQPSRGRNFAAENARQLRRLAQDKRRQREEAARQREESSKPRPLKATRQYQDVKPKVTKFMRSSAKASDTNRQFLQGHSRTGPFLGKDSRRDDYEKRVRTNHDMIPNLDLDIGAAPTSFRGGPTRAESRFGDFSVEERKARIADMVMEIAETPPIGGLGTTPVRRRSPSMGRSRASTVLSREQHRSVQLDGIPAMTVNGNGGNLMKKKSMSLSSLNKQNKPAKVTAAVQTSPEEKIRRIVNKRADSVDGDSTAFLGSPDDELLQERLQSMQDGLGPPMDDGIRAELRLNLEDLALSDDESTEPEIEPSLPVVKGMGIDYIHANKDGASVMGQRKRRPTKEDPLKSAKPPASYKTGSVPKYLQTRKDQWRKDAERIEREKPDPDCPTGHVRLSEDDRVQALSGLNDRYQAVLTEINSFPVRSDTLRVRDRKRDLEAELNHLDEAIRTYSRNVVYVKKEKENDCQERTEK